MEEPKITFEMSAKDLAGNEVGEEDVEELLKVVKEFKKILKPKRPQMKIDRVSFSLISPTS
jgi:hypothetical protein